MARAGNAHGKDVVLLTQYGSLPPEPAAPWGCADSFRKIVFAKSKTLDSRLRGNDDFFLRIPGLATPAQTGVACQHSVRMRTMPCVYTRKLDSVWFSMPDTCPSSSALLRICSAW